MKLTVGIGLLAGFVLVLPLFFEPETEKEQIMEYEKYNLSHALLVRKKILNIGIQMIIFSAVVVIISLCYTFSRQYTTAASFIFGLTRPI